MAVAKRRRYAVSLRRGGARPVTAYTYAGSAAQAKRFAQRQKTGYTAIAAHVDKPSKNGKRKKNPPKKNPHTRGIPGWRPMSGKNLEDGLVGTYASIKGKTAEEKRQAKAARAGFLNAMYYFNANVLPASFPRPESTKIFQQAISKAIRRMERLGARAAKYGKNPTGIGKLAAAEYKLGKQHINRALGIIKAKLQGARRGALGDAELHLHSGFEILDGLITGRQVYRKNPKQLTKRGQAGITFRRVTDDIGLAHSVKYRHRETGKNLVHSFGDRVYLQALDDGSLRLSHPKQRLWAEEEDI